MTSMLAAYVLIGLFFGAEALVRKGDEAKSLTPKSSDRGTTLVIGATYGIAIAGAPLLSHFEIGVLSRAAGLGWGGAALMLFGMALRLWAMRTLGDFYTRTLRVRGGQRIVSDGPYRIVRHPGYLGAMLFWVGAGFAAVNWIATVAIALMMSLAYGYRIKSEEAMLIEAFGDEYRAYMRRTFSLLPLIY